MMMRDNEQIWTVEQMNKINYFVDQNPNVIIITDTNGTIEYVNTKFNQIIGY